MKVNLIRIDTLFGNFIVDNMNIIISAQCLKGCTQMAKQTVCQVQDRCYIEGKKNTECQHTDLCSQK